LIGRVIPVEKAPVGALPSKVYSVTCIVYVKKKKPLKYIKENRINAFRIYAYREPHR